VDHAIPNGGVAVLTVILLCTARVTLPTAAILAEDGTGISDKCIPTDSILFYTHARTHATLVCTHVHNVCMHAHTHTHTHTFTLHIQKNL